MKRLIVTLFATFLFILPAFSQSQDEVSIFVVVEQMPVYPGCEKYDNMKEQNNCTLEKTMQFVAENTKFPKEALDNNVGGTVYIRYVVDEDGEVGNVNVIRGVAGEYGKLLDEEAKRVVSELPKMIAGKQRGEKVKVQYTIPIRFKRPLEKENEK